MDFECVSSGIMTGMVYQLYRLIGLFSYRPVETFDRFVEDNTTIRHDNTGLGKPSIFAHYSSSWMLGFLRGNITAEL